MTLVNTETGELATLDEAGARRLTERIKLMTGSVQDQVAHLSALISEAQSGGAHIALGYRSWTEYVAAEFSDTPLRLDRDDRRELVVSLASQGMSTRAIAPVVGVSQATARRDASAGESNDSPEPDSEIVDAELVDEPEPTPVTGIDGKTYKRPEPKAPRATPRRSLTDQFFDATYDLGKKAESVHRLITDDRFPQNAEKVAAKHRNDLLRVRDLIEQVISALPSKESTHD